MDEDIHKHTKGNEPPKDFVNTCFIRQRDSMRWRKKGSRMGVQEHENQDSEIRKTKEAFRYHI
jgi:hypothetical protein